MNAVCGEILIVDLPLLTGVRRTRRLLPLRPRHLLMLSFLASLPLSLVLHKKKREGARGGEGKKARVVKLILTGRELDPFPPTLFSRVGVPQPRERPAHWILDGKPVQRPCQGFCCFACC